jgi:hypothetical protein
MTGPFTLTITATVVAWYAAIVSTIGLVIQGMNYLRDRVRIKISYAKNMKEAGRYSDPDIIFTIVKVVNAGRRPVTITHIGEQHLTSTGAFLSDTNPTGPCQLTEGQHMIAKVNQRHIDFDNVRYFFAIDATGREHRLYLIGRFSRVSWAVRRYYNRLTETSG